MNQNAKQIARDHIGLPLVWPGRQPKKKLNLALADGIALTEYSTDKRPVDNLLSSIKNPCT
jgi:hypothetical protein